MKKIAFALQVFMLVAALPLYVIVELNHARVTSTENNIIKKTGRGVNIISSDFVLIQHNKAKI